MNPYDSDSFPDPLSSFEFPDGAQPIYYDEHGNPTPFSPMLQTQASQFTSDSASETESEYPEPQVATDPTESSVHMTDLKNIREVLATLSHYNGGQLGQYLKQYHGLLIMPLHGVSTIRIPHGRHVGNYPILIYYPKKPLNRYPHLENFNEAISAIYGEPSE